MTHFEQSPRVIVYGSVSGSVSVVFQVRDLNNDGYVDHPMGTVLSGLRLEPTEMAR